ncbi:MAG TPA: SPFH domain-containing protein [Kiritimatiellia bacterium]|mgnify:FL=1|nr:SPFH domain-containing protein [Kiritimatiellia bacterium]HMP35254.1 SPFH domain-containing protein [Kiritimatiellia bacterium]
MEPLVVILMILAVFVVLFVAKGLVIVQQAETSVIERLGKFNRILDSGINIIWPIIDQPRQIAWRITQTDNQNRKVHLIRNSSRIDLREQVFDFPRQNVITRDNVNIEIDALLYFQITDPVKMVYEIANLPLAIEKLTQTTLRNVIGEMDLDESLTSRDTINGKLRSILDEATDKWGVKINRVELQDITPPKEIQETMEKQMRAERDRRATILVAEGDKRSRILEAEGQREAEVNKAEGEKQAAILRAEGEARAVQMMAEAEAAAIQRIAQAVGGGVDPTKYLIAVKYVETLKHMVSGEGNKVVYMPYEATAILGSVGGIRDIFEKVGGAKS